LHNRSYASYLLYALLPFHPVINTFIIHHSLILIVHPPHCQSTKPLIYFTLLYV